MKDPVAGNENIATGAMFQGKAMERLRAAVHDKELTPEELQTARREFAEDLQCAVSHLVTGFEQLTGA